MCCSLCVLCCLLSASLLLDIMWFIGRCCFVLMFVVCGSVYVVCGLLSVLLLLLYGDRCLLFVVCVYMCRSFVICRMLFVLMFVDCFVLCVV